MKKIIIILLLLISIVHIYAQLYESLLDSIEIAFNNANIKKIDLLSNMLLEADSSRYEGYFYKAYVFYKKRDYDNALKFCKNSFDIEKKAENTYLYLILNSKLDKDFRAILLFAIDSFPKDKRFLNFYANQFKLNSQYDSMFYYSKRVLNIDYKDINALDNCGYYFLLKKNYKNALKYYKSLYNLNKNSYYGFILAQLYNKLNYYDRSNEILNTIDDRDYDYKVKRLIADNYFLKYDYDNALKYNKYLITHFPDSIEPYINITAIMSKKTDTLFLDSFLIMIKNTNLNNKDLNSIADNLFNMGLYSHSIDIYKEILGKDSLYYNENAMKCGIFTGDFKFAYDILNNCKDTNIEDASALYYMGLVYYKNNLFIPSKESFECALRLSPGDSIVILNLANTYYVLKEDAKLLSLIDSINKYNDKFANYLLKTYFPENKE